MKKDEDIVMEAVLKVPLEDIEQLVNQVNQEETNLYIANLNSSTQTVIGGTQSAVDQFKKLGKEKGIRKIEREQLFGAKPGEIGMLVITAHGSGPDVYEIAKIKGIEVFDTTCPKVIKAQRLAKVYANRNYKIIIVGDKGHKEVRGINEWGDGNAFIISEEKDLEKLDFKFKKEERMAVFSQTTQNEEFFLKIGKEIKRKCEKAEIINTTCDTTHKRQEEVRKMAKSNEIMVVIGSKNSANSRRLWEISKSINPRSYFIEKLPDLKKEWLRNKKNAGIVAGASTPEWIIGEVMDKLAAS